MPTLGYDFTGFIPPPRLAYDAAMPGRRRAGRDEAPDPISAVLQFAAEYIPEDQREPFGKLVEALLTSIDKGHEDDAEREELERLAAIGKKAEQSSDRRPGRASDSAFGPARIDRLVRDAAARRQAATDQTLAAMFPDLDRIGQAWGR